MTDTPSPEALKGIRLFIALAVVSAVLLYLLFAFAAWDLNAANWPVEVRSLLALSWAFSLGIPIAPIAFRIP